MKLCEVQLHIQVAGRLQTVNPSMRNSDSTNTNSTVLVLATQGRTASPSPSAMSRIAQQSSGVLRHPGVCFCNQIHTDERVTTVMIREITYPGKTSE